MSVDAGVKKYHICKKGFYLESFYMQLLKWKIFSRYYRQLSIASDEILDADAKSYNEVTKAFPTNFNEKM